MTTSAAVRVRLRYSDLDTFVEKFAPNVTRGGIFLASKAPRAVGEVFHFEVQLSTGAVALAGEGKVIWVKPFDAAEPQKPHGMGVQFVQVDAGSRATLDRILQVKSTRPAGAAAPRTTQPHQVLARSGAGAGSNGRARVDTSVDLAAEFGIDEATLRRVIDRNWTLGPRGHEDVEALLKPDPSEAAVGLAEALAELPRLLDPGSRHRSGAQRLLESLAREKAGHESTPANGASKTHDAGDASHQEHPKPLD